VCVLGLGQVGLPTAEYIASRGFKVFGYDIVEKRSNVFQTYTDWKDVPGCSTYVICVVTRWIDEKPDASAVFDVCKKISTRKGKPLVCIESTVPVGTCRKVAELFEDVHLVHVPHRWWSGDSDKHGIRQLRVIGALDDNSMRVGKAFYQKLAIPLFELPSLEAGEITKIAENAYRFVQIAFVEELRMTCERNNIPFSAVWNGINTKWNVKLLEARDGIFGECLPKDTRYLAYLGEAPLTEGAIEADEKYKRFVRPQA